MTYRILMTPEADAEFKREVAYSARKWGKKHSLKYAESLWQFTQNIGHAPFAYPLKSWGQHAVRAGRHQGNWVVYRVLKETRTVQILGFPSRHRTTSYTSDDV